MIVTNRIEIVSMVADIELDADKLVEVVRSADSARALCTSYDPVGFDLIMMNARAARGLREMFCGERWEPDDTDNQAGIRNPHRKLRVIHCNFDKHAGDSTTTPANLTEKGAASRAKVRCNRTGWIPGLPKPMVEQAEYTTYVLGTYFDAKRGLRAELSRPIGFSSGHYIDFKPRVILLDGSEDSPVGDTGRDREGPTDTIDIPVQRK